MTDFYRLLFLLLSVVNQLSELTNNHSTKHQWKKDTISFWPIPKLNI